MLPSVKQRHIWECAYNVLVSSELPHTDYSLRLMFFHGVPMIDLANKTAEKYCFND